MTPYDNIPDEALDGALRELEQKVQRKEQITRMPATSFRFSSMLGTEKGSPREANLLRMLMGDFSRVLMPQMG